MRTTIMSGDSAPSVHQTRHKLLVEALQKALRAVVQAGPGAANGIGSVSGRAVAALHQVLLNHSIDRRGRCRSCRRPGAVFGRRYRRCRVHFDVDYWLRQPDEQMLLGHLVSELSQQFPQQPESSSRTPATLPPPSLPGGSPGRGGRIRIAARPGSHTPSALGLAVVHLTITPHLSPRSVVLSPRTTDRVSASTGR